jgi:hypothetical protein
MEKRYALLRRHGAIDGSRFRRDWRVAGQKFEGNGACLQNHLRGLGDEAPVWDGIGEFELDADRAWLADESFVDQARSIFVDGSTFVVNDGPQKGFKLLALTRRSSRFDRRAFAEYWRFRHVEVLRGLPGFWSRLGRYVQHLLEPDSARSLSNMSIGFSYDGLAELWFETEAAAAQAASDPEVAEAIKADDQHFLSLPYERYVSEQVVIGPFVLPNAKEPERLG